MPFELTAFSPLGVTVTPTGDLTRGSGFGIFQGFDRSSTFDLIVNAAGTNDQTYTVRLTSGDLRFLGSRPLDLLTPANARRPRAFDADPGRRRCALLDRQGVASSPCLNDCPTEESNPQLPGKGLARLGVRVQGVTEVIISYRFFTSN